MAILHDLAFAEITKIAFGWKVWIVKFRLFCSAFDTYATGFALAQTAINSKLGARQKFFVNTAPRKDDLTPRVKIPVKALFM